MSPILKLFAFPASFIIICLGILTILGGHITPGGGFQGGAMIAAGVILCVIVYGVNDSPIKFSHDFISAIESIGALGYVLLGLAGLFASGFFLYNLGADFYGIVPQSIVDIFHYPDLTNAGIVPYLNIFVGLKVLVGLSAVVIAFLQFKKLDLSEEIEEE
ncbi:MAG: cation:proton antiporter [Methanobrevibacter sp.]|jgi:energy-converting hydrogenase B subunit I|nr:cation:proton antiporter [Methanobrevibacter sp.]